MLSIPGTKVLLEYDTYVDAPSGRLRSSEQQKIQITGGSTFRQETGLVEQSIDVTSPNGNGNSKTYAKAIGSDSAAYGVTTTSTDNNGVPVNISAYYTPALTLPLSPALNTPYVRKVVNTVTLNGVTQSSPLSQTITFVAVELVSVPAGIFISCKSKIEGGFSGGTLITGFTWTSGAGRLKGILLKATGDQLNQLKELSAVPLVNGQ